MCGGFVRCSQTLIRRIRPFARSWFLRACGHLSKGMPENTIDCKQFYVVMKEIQDGSGRMGLRAKRLEILPESVKGICRWKGAEIEVLDFCRLVEGYYERFFHFATLKQPKDDDRWCTSEGGLDRLKFRFGQLESARFQK